MMSMSRSGSVLPSTWVTFGSSKQRTTWMMASVVRNVRKELVAEALTLGRALDKACNVDEFDRGGREFLRLMQIAQPLQTRIRHGHDADIRIDGAEGVVIGGNARICDRVEQRGLADVRQSDDTKFQGC